MRLRDPPHPTRNAVPRALVVDLAGWARRGESCSTACRATNCAPPVQEVSVEVGEAYTLLFGKGKGKPKGDEAWSGPTEIEQVKESGRWVCRASQGCGAPSALVVADELES